MNEIISMYEFDKYRAHMKCILEITDTTRLNPNKILNKQIYAFSVHFSKI